MKTLRAYRDNGTAKGEYVPGWQFGTFKGIQVGNGATRNIAGWELRSPDGVVRLSEGNYQQFVPFANTVLSNYGCKPTVS